MMIGSDMRKFVEFYTPETFKSSNLLQGKSVKNVYM